MSPAASASRLRTLGLVLAALCLLLGAVEVMQQYAANALRGGAPPLLWMLAVNYLPWLAVAPLLPLVVRLAERHPLDRGRWRRTLPVHLAAMLGLVLAHQSAAALAAWAFPGAQPVDLGWVIVKLLLFRSALDVLVYWAAVGAAHAVMRAAEASERAETAARLEATLAEARLAALRDQLDPHFLFNTLNAISTLALVGDRDGLLRTLGALSDLLRQSLDRSRRQEVPLAEELAFLERYLEIQQVRVGERLTVTRDFADDALDAAVPSMLLQPLVENAFQHGIARRPGPARLALRARREGATLVIEVEDDGPGPVEGAVEGIGLRNTRARLAQLYGPAHALRLEATPGGGARVVAVLPHRSLGTPTPVPLGLDELAPPAVGAEAAR
jgi:signal transduction histidine kinase